jgi:hypothetical protein
MRSLNIFLTTVVAGLFVLALAGCNPDRRYTKVSGTITYNGQVVEGASVSFLPAGPDGEPASGRTDASGRYTLTSVYAVSGGTGVLPGEYTVLVVKSEMPPDPYVELYNQGRITSEELERRQSARLVGLRPIELLPEKYMHPGTTGLRATVERGKDNTFDFDLTD